MPRRRLGARVNGPYFDTPSGKYKLRVFSGELDKGRDLYFETEREATQARTLINQDLSTPTRRLLSDVLAEYMADKEQRGKARPETCVGQHASLRRFFGDSLEQPIGELNQKRAAALYASAVDKPRKNGARLQAATHRFYLELARGFFDWAVRKSYVDGNPWHSVEPVGRVSAGKPQLRLEEARPFAQTAFRLFDDHRDVMALASVVPLYLGLRASEVLRRRVRDVDAAGALLWIDGGKTRHARRHLKIEAPELRERLLQLSAGRGPEEPLFGYGDSGKPWRRQALWSAVQRICQAAQVPRVCPHSLKGQRRRIASDYAGLQGRRNGRGRAGLGTGGLTRFGRVRVQPRAVDAAAQAA